MRVPKASIPEDELTSILRQLKLTSEYYRLKSILSVVVPLIHELLESETRRDVQANAFELIRIIEDVQAGE